MIVQAWVDAPLVTVESRTDRTGFIWPWQSNKKGQIRIHQPFYAYGTFDDGTHIRMLIPEGFPTDFYSIPLIVRPLIPKSLVGWNQAAVVHDRLYYHNTLELYNDVSRTWITDVPCNRYVSDQMLRALMIQFEAPLWRRVLIYRGVRLGGSASWDKRRKQNGNLQTFTRKE